MLLATVPKYEPEKENIEKVTGSEKVGFDDIFKVE